MMTPRSIGIIFLGFFGSGAIHFLSRGNWLLVPTMTRPPATTGPPYALEPRSATHLTFFAFWPLPPMSHSLGRPLTRRLTMLRLGDPPYMNQPSLPAAAGWSPFPLSPAPERLDRAPISTTTANTAAVTTPASQRRNVG